MGFVKFWHFLLKCIISECSLVPAQSIMILGLVTGSKLIRFSLRIPQKCTSILYQAKRGFISGGMDIISSESFNSHISKLVDT